MRWIALVTVWVTVGLTALLADIAVTRAGGVGTEPPSVIVHGASHFSDKQVARLLNQALWRQAGWKALAEARLTEIEAATRPKPR